MRALKDSGRGTQPALLTGFVAAALAAVSLLAPVAGSAQGTMYYVRAGAGGNGSDWNNAFSSLPSTLVRGATYYVADGSYGGYTFDDANSGTSLITVKKATASDHGTNTGWSAAYGDGQATFGGLTFLRGYYVFDGQTGGGPGNWESGFGFKVNGEISMQQFVDNGADRITLRHTEINVGQTGPNNVRGMTLYGSDFFTLSYVYLHDSGCDLISMNVMNDFTIEYSKLARNRQAEPGCHGDLIEYQIGDARNFTIRYNFFEDIVGSYAFGSHGPTITNYEIYGNIFYWTIEPFFGNGLVGCLSGGGTLQNVRFYNNTLSGNLTNNVGNVGFGILRGSGHQAFNNIWHRQSGTGFSHGWSNTSHSNNTFYNGSGGGDQNLSGNPFVASSSRNFALAAATSAGSALSSPYNVDMTGKARGSDGTWDRGALERSGASTTPPAPAAPTNVQILR
jgi:hypothetical protein